MNLDKWRQKCVVDRLVENAWKINIPRGMSVSQVEKILDHVVLALATNWREIREEIQLYKAALPYLEKVGRVDKVPKPLHLLLGDMFIVGKRESSTDQARAVKQAVECATDWELVSREAKEVNGKGNKEIVEEYRGTPTAVGKPCYGLVADVLNATSDPEDDKIWGAFNVNRL